MAFRWVWWKPRCVSYSEMNRDINGQHTVDLKDSIPSSLPSAPMSSWEGSGEELLLPLLLGLLGIDLEMQLSVCCGSLTMSFSSNSSFYTRPAQLTPLCLYRTWLAPPPCHFEPHTKGSNCGHLLSLLTIYIIPQNDPDNLSSYRVAQSQSTSDHLVALSPPRVSQEDHLLWCSVRPAWSG